MSDVDKRIEEIVSEAIIQGMIAMQRSMSDGKPGRHEKVIKDCIIALKELIVEAEMNGILMARYCAGKDSETEKRIDNLIRSLQSKKIKE